MKYGALCDYQGQMPNSKDREPQPQSHEGRPVAEWGRWKITAGPQVGNTGASCSCHCRGFHDRGARSAVLPPTLACFKQGLLSPGVRRNEYVRYRTPWKAEQIRSKWVISPSSIFYLPSPPTIRGQEGTVNRHCVPQRQIRGTHKYKVEYTCKCC